MDCGVNGIDFRDRDIGNDGKRVVRDGIPICRRCCPRGKVPGPVAIGFIPLVRLNGNVVTHSGGEYALRIASCVATLVS